MHCSWPPREAGSENGENGKRSLTVLLTTRQEGNADCYPSEVLLHGERHCGVSIAIKHTAQTGHRSLNHMINSIKYLEPSEYVFGISNPFDSTLDSHSHTTKLSSMVPSPHFDVWGNTVRSFLLSWIHQG